MIEALTDILDPRLDEFRQIRDRPLYEDSGKFIAESPEVVKRLLASGLEVRAILLSHQVLPRLQSALRDDIPAFLVDDAQVRELVGFPFHRGALAIGTRPQRTELPATLRRILVLEDLVDVDNVGAAVRNAAAFGIEAIVLSPRCADPFYRKAIRAAMGATFDMPILRLSRWPEPLFDLLGRHGLALVGTVVDQSVRPLGELQTDRGLAIAFGNEGAGLTPALKDACDELVTIPTASLVDSLNVAAAVAVVLHHCRPRNAGSEINP